MVDKPALRIHPQTGVALVGSSFRLLLNEPEESTENLVNNLELILCARQLALYKSLCQHFGDISSVEVVFSDIVQIPNIDAVVSPANAYGWMDGGIDQVYVYTFGKQIETRVQAKIQCDYDRELAVGNAFVIETHHETIPYLIVAPTMRIPGPIRGTRNPFLAMKTVLTTVSEFNQSRKKKMTRVACPGLGTGTGGISFEEAAKQMREAYDSILFDDQG